MMETREELVTVNTSVTVVLCILTSFGIILTAVFLIFNCVFRRRKIIQFSSPNLNYVIGVGALLLYMRVYFMAIPSTDPTVVAVFCNLSSWLTSLGFSLCFGTILAKTFRVYYTFHNPKSRRKRHIKDYHLALCVCALVVVDVVILLVYTLVEGLRGNLAPHRVTSDENPSYTLAAREVEFQYFIYSCRSNARDIVLGILYGCKFLLHAAAVVLALQIRRVTIKPLNDSREVIMATYVGGLMIVIILVFNYTVSDRINLYAMLTNFSLSIGTTAIMVLVFVPKMIELYKDPHGTNVFVHEKEKEQPVSFKTPHD